ncbi:TetR family transcriptional regulator [Embleya sp. AB8]|uniref:TetR family transcriptional regulator n=1 Tax=Embleya sp. AB8 TaxID=3156304 RepID=UPI003C7669E7
MADDPLTPEQILGAAEDVLRRYGPAKATVVDVARALGVSHGSVYRHFPSKQALREAVTRGWLDRTHDTLAVVLAADGTPAERLSRWLAGLFAAKRAKASADPELFAAYMQLANQASAEITRHVEGLLEQLTGLVADGIADGSFAPTDPRATAVAIFHATDRFHDPVHAADWAAPETEAAFENVRRLLLAGLTNPTPATSSTPATPATSPTPATPGD